MGAVLSAMGVAERNDPTAEATAVGKRAGPEGCSLLSSIVALGQRARAPSDCLGGALRASRDLHPLWHDLLRSSCSLYPAEQMTTPQRGFA